MREVDRAKVIQKERRTLKRESARFLLIDKIVRYLTVILIPIISAKIAFLVLSLYFEFSIFLCLILSVAICIAVYILIAEIFFTLQNPIKRGQESGTYKEAKEKLERSKQPNEKGLPFGGVLLPEESATGHFLVVGTTGSGKTVTIKLLMNAALSTVGTEPDHRAILLDAKRELYAYLLKIGFHPSQIHTLNPFDLRGAAWDIAKDIDTEAQAVELANALVPPPEKEGDNAFFGKAARRILAGVIHSFILTSDEREGRGEERIDWTLRDLIIALRYEESIRHILKKHDETRYLINKYFRNDKTVNDVLSTLDTAISDFNIVAALWENAAYKISLKSWAYDKEGSIILLGWDKEHKKSLDPLNRLIFQRLSDILINQGNSPERRTWIFLDELREIAGGLPGLVQLLNMGREKGDCCVLGVIDIKGLMSALGEKVAEEVTGLCDNVAALRTRSAATADWLSKMFGNAEVREVRISQNAEGKQSLQNQLSEKRTFLYGEFQQIEKPIEENNYTIGGYYLNAYTKPYKFDFEGTGKNGWHKKVSRVTEKEVNNFGVVKRPKEHYRLKLWSENDLNRLELELNLEMLFERKQKEQTHAPKFLTEKFKLALV